MSRSRLTPATSDFLHALSCLVFADLDELATLTGTLRSTTHYRLDKLIRRDLVSSVPHSVGRVTPKRTHQRTRQRFFPTLQGIKEAAADVGTEPSEFWKGLPVHPQVFRQLTDRIDALASIYSLSAMILRVAVCTSATLDHYISVKSSPYDAMLRLDDGPAIGILRVGRRQAASRFLHRWNAVVRDQDRWPDAVLIVTATPTGWRRTYEIIAARPGPPTFCAQEQDVLKKNRRVWGAPADEEVMVISLLDLVRRLPSKQESSPATPAQRTASQIDVYPENLPATSAAVRLTPAEKELLDVISDWHLVHRRFLPGLAGVDTVRVSQIIPALIEQGLVTSLPTRGALLYALSDRGLQYIAGRDRVALPLAVWSVELTGPMGALGGKMRSLYRELGHTVTVQRLMSDLAKEAGELSSYSLSELDPPERALLRPNHMPERTGIEPDAGGRIRCTTAAGTHWLSFTLEYERRAITERRASSKVGLYQAFFASGHKWGPSGPPLALFVFDTPADEQRFFDVAKRLESDEHRDVLAPFALSNLTQIKSTGFLGHSWLVPEEGGETDRLRLIQVNADQATSR